MASDFDFDDDAQQESGSAGKARKDYDCPSCNANNPLDEPLVNGDEVRCNYCGCEFKATVNAEGRMKFKEV
ncbi:hypothetical protein JGU66_21205 [Myxococcaceae bacterium JPH2]|nr:hypothetical protein [Myxococcaceae bacterium JPH2]